MFPVCGIFYIISVKVCYINHFRKQNDFVSSFVPYLDKIKLKDYLSFFPKTEKCM